MNLMSEEQERRKRREMINWQVACETAVVTKEDALQVYKRLNQLDEYREQKRIESNKTC